MSKLIISPSILSADFANLERDIKRVEDAGADWLHIDVMDGHFVPNITIGVPVTASIKKIAKIPLDVHLMIENPKKYVEPFVHAGADILTFHYEAVKEDEVIPMVKYIKSFGIKAGMSVKPLTSVLDVLKYIPEVDMLLIMTVEPGFSGQTFLEDCAEKIKPVRAAFSDLIIQVDGGINAETGKICRSYGANSIVAGNFIYKSNDIQRAVSLLRSL